MIAQLIFIALLGVGGFLAYKRFLFVKRNILMGRDVAMEGNAADRWNTMFRVALGQGKMFTRPIAAIFHLFLYLGFVIINIEVVEIILDGILGQHRLFHGIGGVYNVLIGAFEILAFLVIVGCVVFLIRRNVMKIARFHWREMTKWPKSDANIILITEIALMSAFLKMNAAESILAAHGVEHYVNMGNLPISQWIVPFLQGFSNGALVAIERFCWWFHIIGILAFIVYLSYSKHLHILLAFPNTYYSKLQPAGQLSNMSNVTNEVKLMMDPSAQVVEDPLAPKKFGAKDVEDLTWVQLMNAYSCTECGRCTSVCPANQTGKLLSPRKIMMDTRDRMEEVGRCKDAGLEYSDKSLLGDYITFEELWACTSCNACTEACPVNINPLDIIIDLRRYLMMEESQSPESITTMLTNIENNGAPWAFAQADRGNWTKE